MNKILIASSIAALCMFASCVAVPGASSTGPKGELTVVYLKNVPSADVATTLRGFLEQEAAAAGEPQTVVIQSDANSNSLLIRAPGEKWKQLARLIDSLDIKRS